MSEQENLEELYGPAAAHSEHAQGETILFYDSEIGQERQGTILWVCAPGEQAGQQLPVRYVVDTPGFPTYVWPSDVIEA